ncbi:MAG: hypothetical protein LBH76_10635 [Propionibacteriaceae bacterium]|jgi:FixJ family two-component response regulator|nr:hypothetical protein [Propionibacteriaceae bacterium]
MGTVLVIADDPHIRELVEALLRSARFAAVVYAGTPDYDAVVLFDRPSACPPSPP